MSNAQLPPDELTAENELICTKLLGLTKHCGAPSCPDWRTADGKRYWNNPTFDNWADAGLILDALLGQFCAVEVCTAKWTDGEVRSGVQITPYDPRERRTLTTHGLPLSGPLALRAAALEYIRSTP